ncbi:MAG: VPLPA-CTERM sorting domain-containing protein, partial [Pseudomonadota bacterium]
SCNFKLARRRHSRVRSAAMAGQSFTINDLISIDIEVSGNSIPTFKIDGTEPMQILSGRISSNGLFANFSDFFFGRSGGLSFGCDFRLCEQGTRPGENYNIVSGLAFTSTTSYPVSGRALGGLNAQLAVTQDPLDPNPIDPDPIDPDPVNPTPPSVVPLPSSAPLLLAGLAGLAFWRRRSRTA